MSMDPPVKPEGGGLFCFWSIPPNAIVLPRLDRGINRTIHSEQMLTSDQSPYPRA